jgi:hypothetical protein
MRTTKQSVIAGMTRNLLLIMLLNISFCVSAQPNYTNGVFILNEDWFGHNNSTLNFLHTDTGIFDYLIVQNNADNAGLSLGCTSQFGTVYGDNLYIISKQDQDPGESNLTGGRVVVLDARTMKIKKTIPVIFQLNGKSAADGRSFVGVDETKGYIGTSNGIYMLNLQNFDVGNRIAGSENPLITGGENNANGIGPLYNNQIGMMLRTTDYVFAIQQDKGVLVINPETDTVEKVIEGCFSTMTQSKDGTVWVGKNSNPTYPAYPYGTVGEQWDGNQLLKIDPYTLDTEIIDITSGGVNQTWYAWTAGSLCASAKENALYFTFNESKWDWFTTSKMYRYDIDGQEFTQIYDSEIEQRYFYSAGIRINPLDDKIYASIYLDNINQSYFFYQLDNEGNRLKEYEPIQRYWFPALFIFPDNHAPVVSEFNPVTINSTQPVAIDLSARATDEDNLDIAITKRIISNDNESAVLAVIKNNTLTLTVKGNQTGTAHITVRFNSNGKTTDRIVTVQFAVSGTGVKDAASDKINVFARNGAIHITGLQAKTEVRIFNVQGQLVRSEMIYEASSISGLPGGQIYVVKIESKHYKIRL